MILELKADLFAQAMTTKDEGLIVALHQEIRAIDSIMARLQIEYDYSKGE